MKLTIIKGDTFEGEELLTLEELCLAVHAPQQIVVEMIEQQLIEPIGNQPREWRFDSICLKRVKTAVSFHQDLEVNLAGIALALDLLKQIEALEKRIALLEKFEEE